MSEERDQKLAAIQAQGELVRALKAAKEAPEKVHHHHSPFNKTQTVFS